LPSNSIPVSMPGETVAAIRAITANRKMLPRKKECPQL
jgi:hypothetical protein